MPGAVTQQPKKPSVAGTGGSTPTRPDKDLIEYYGLRDFSKSLNVIVVYRLPQSTITSHQVAEVIHCMNAPSHQNLTAADVERIYDYLKTHPYKWYNPWIRLEQHPDQAQRVLHWLGQQLERAKEFEKGVKALRAELGE